MPDGVCRAYDYTHTDRGKHLDSPVVLDGGGQPGAITAPRAFD